MGDQQSGIGLKAHARNLKLIELIVDQTGDLGDHGLRVEEQAGVSVRLGGSDLLHSDRAGGAGHIDDGHRDTQHGFHILCKKSCIGVGVAARINGDDHLDVGGRIRSCAATAAGSTAAGPAAGGSAAAGSAVPAATGQHQAAHHDYDHQHRKCLLHFISSFLNFMVNPILCCQ